MKKEHWPEPKDENLRAVVDELRSRSKAIHHHGSTSLSCGSDNGEERLSVSFTSQIHDWPEVELSLWEDFAAQITVRSRKRKTLGKKLLWMEGVRFQRRPHDIVEAFLATVQAPPKKESMERCLDLWTKLEDT